MSNTRRDLSFRGKGKRRIRREKQVKQVKKDREQLDKKFKIPIKIWYKSVDNETVPTDYLIVEFNLKHKISANEFESILYEKMEGII